MEYISIYVHRYEFGCIRTCFCCVSYVYPFLSEVKDLLSKNGIQIHKMTFMDNADYPVRFCCTQLVAAVTCTKMQLKDLHNRHEIRVSFSKIMMSWLLDEITLSRNHSFIYHKIDIQFLKYMKFPLLPI